MAIDPSDQRLQIGIEACMPSPECRMDRKQEIIDVHSLLRYSQQARNRMQCSMLRVSGYLLRHFEQISR